MRVQVTSTTTGSEGRPFAARRSTCAGRRLAVTGTRHEALAHRHTVVSRATEVPPRWGRRSRPGAPAAQPRPRDGPPAAALD